MRASFYCALPSDIETAGYGGTYLLCVMAHGVAGLVVLDCVGDEQQDGSVMTGIRPLSLVDSVFLIWAFCRHLG